MKISEKLPRNLRPHRHYNRGFLNFFSLTFTGCIVATFEVLTWSLREFQEVTISPKRKAVMKISFVRVWLRVTINTYRK